jgi:pSer/pThr/pTyr-binding forkhead associated (FHA) protein
MGITVGRVETNDVIVDDGSVSRFHAWLQLDERKKAWFLCDAESKNGTFLGPQRLTANQKVALGITTPRTGKPCAIGKKMERPSRRFQSQPSEMRARSWPRS